MSAVKDLVCFGGPLDGLEVDPALLVDGKFQSGIHRVNARFCSDLIWPVWEPTETMPDATVFYEEMGERLQFVESRGGLC